ncbi:uncharacterized protein LOC110111862 [Dendrobium catenatum]|uniref:DUF761 domain-containing protein n=1 Tax=Dendrobium catenatum TaxID=906689 RepID=A0A2I0WSQ9_9ASPA|nr:uncharacterized protein LOC110111862 [Dendrobium catenatum]PKU78699.1 hypothetical protein MA16_Dca000042 [Dendrobium catenatum]
MKQTISLLMAILKAKSMAVKSKASAVKTRFIIFKLLHDKNALIGVFPHKKNEFSFDEEQANPHEKTIILHNGAVECVEEKYNNLEDDAEFDGDSGERDGEFDLEDEIDQAADIFIRKFRKEMMIQKQESFKMYQEMLARGV